MGISNLPPLPPVRNQMSIRDMFVDGTPDGRLAIRILKAHRRRCDERWLLEGEWEEGTRALYDLMNQHQDARSKELDEAIAILERAAHGA